MKAPLGDTIPVGLCVSGLIDSAAHSPLGLEPHPLGQGLAHVVRTLHTSFRVFSTPLC
jgi:hypothetical protein